MKGLNVYFNEWKKDYRHFICIGITLISLAAWFLFPNSLPRVAESVRDFGTSFAYYFCEIFLDSHPVPPTINQMPTWEFFPDKWEPLKLFPLTWEEFAVLWGKYWIVLFTKENFLAYWDAFGTFMEDFSKVLLLVVPLTAALILCLGNYKNKRCMKRGKKSLPLRVFEKFLFNVVYPIIAWIKDFVFFCRENKKYPQAWLLLWLLHFNVISIGISAVGYYFYLTSSFDFKSLYTQLLKLLSDITPAIRFIPGFIWVLIGIWVYNYICRSMAFTRLYYAERCNRAFLSKRGVVTTVYGEMGIGKTQMITSMALSSEIEQFDMAFEIMLEKDMQFPNFPWQRLRDELRKRIDRREIVDLPSCRKFIQRSRVFFDRIRSIHSAEYYQYQRQKHGYFRFDHTFGYDYTHYRITYNDELKITHLYEALEDYACAYLIFTVKTSLLFSNYSIRVDSILQDLGNMPSRDNDFFNREPEFQEAYSHHAHIIDFDMLRLGKKIIKDNPKARRLTFGTFVITEIDKEFKNTQVLKEVKMNTEETNQKNDLHDACLMMCRHAAVVANRVFIRIIADLQRPEAWGAGGRELGEVIYISDKTELTPALPFFSPYWLCQGLFSWIKSKWKGFKNVLDINRSDDTLFTYLCRNTTSVINNHYDKVEGLFGTQTLKLEMQSGRMDGDIRKEKWRIITKKDRARRYRTACLEAVFDSYKPNTMHVDDFICYAGEVGTQNENETQNSYFQTDIKKMKELNAILQEDNKAA